MHGSGLTVEIAGLTKSFGSIRAVDGLDMVVRPGVGGDPRARVDQHRQRPAEVDHRRRLRRVGEPQVPAVVDPGEPEDRVLAVRAGDVHGDHVRHPVGPGARGIDHGTAAHLLAIGEGQQPVRADAVQPVSGPDLRPRPARGGKVVLV